MVTVINYLERQTEDGRTFYLLELQGKVEFVQSQITGNYYATTRRCKIPATFDVETCISLLGTQIEGHIEKINCEPYKYLIRETGEIIELTYRWAYVPDNVTQEKHVIETPQFERKASKNGQKVLEAA